MRAAQKTKVPPTMDANRNRIARQMAVVARL
jgi:hypothetical protein